eukprot:scaffold67621_cov20-Tisochrysis_lutea.AAC.1
MHDNCKGSAQHDLRCMELARLLYCKMGACLAYTKARPKVRGINRYGGCRRCMCAQTASMTYVF